MMKFVHLTGLNGDPIKVMATHVLCVGVAMGQKQSSLVPGQMLTSAVGTMVSVQGVNFVVQESVDEVVLCVEAALAPPETVVKYQPGSIAGLPGY